MFKVKVDHSCQEQIDQNHTLPHECCLKTIDEDSKREEYCIKIGDEMIHFDPDAGLRLDDDEITISDWISVSKIKHAADVDAELFSMTIEEIFSNKKVYICDFSLALIMPRVIRQVRFIEDSKDK